jgi:hypothetical protein
LSPIEFVAQDDPYTKFTTTRDADNTNEGRMKIGSAGMIRPNTTEGISASPGGDRRSKTKRADLGSAL